MELILVVRTRFECNGIRYSLSIETKRKKNNENEMEGCIFQEGVVLTIFPLKCPWALRR
jgi:hypothetical protein